MDVYLSGPMSPESFCPGGCPDDLCCPVHGCSLHGLPAEPWAFNRPAFDATEEMLTGNGMHVLNPARIPGDPSWTWQQWMKAALTMQMQADAIYMLTGWRKSRGAQLEHQVATATGMRIYGARA